MGGVLTNSVGHSAPAVPWTPADLGTNLKAWYNPDLDSFANGATYSSMTDRSGNGFTATGVGASLLYQNAAARPQFGGHSSCRVDGGAGAFYYNMSGGLLSGASEGLVFAVVQCASDPGVGVANGPLVCGFGATTGRFLQTTGEIFEGFGTTTLRIANPTPAMNTSPRVYIARSKSADFKMRVDGTQILSAGTNTVDFTGATRRIGATMDTANRFDGLFGMIGFCAAVTDPEMEKLEGYLAHRFGLQANLDAGHPYKAAPP